ncbi:glycoside hydrolase family 127 protein [Flavihumibacter profundi]|uniref:glycoside hydrolase family 127 protein n=1 Tax=Flavihumibacter profundi TaxID=2716883 RepID=UPI001CC475CC|nr:glycoside hydrolase family 127 protein [Flavihumibacter profundi]MBZ5858909.1 glycoside hydrolase family 127 protein [Flavihumibacter profundi]
MKRLFPCMLAVAMISSAIQAQSYIPVKNDTRFKVHPVAPIKAYGFDLKDIHIDNGSPLKNAMDKDAAYLLFLDPNRLLSRFYTNAGLPAKGEKYDGWESEAISGHTLGHYLSAISMMYASSGNKEFKKRADYIVAELARCQSARGTGYVGAMPGEDSCFAKLSRGDIKTGGFDLNGLWSPWYVVHKVMDGLVDAYYYTGNKEALQVVIGISDWTARILKDLNAEQLQKMLRCEYGGMNDVLAQVYAITGDKRHLATSYKFYDDFVMAPLSKQIDPLPGKHSNTNVPKAIGSATQYEITGNKSDQTIASFFWNTMVHHHSYVIGGNSNYEYCGEEDKLSDRLSDNTCETCNTYNMLKLTRHLFSWSPSAKLGDYYERALYNHILASQNPEDGMMCYFVPLRMGTKKQFSDSLHTFTCCVGSGMENHSKYGEGIYYEGADGSLYVNLFIPSTLNWRSKKISIRQETDFPTGDTVNFTIQSKGASVFPLKIRKPAWSDKTIIYVNGQPLSVTVDIDGFIVINRSWKNKDRVQLVLSKQLYTEAMPDNANRIAILYGPLVLAGSLGTTMPDPVFGTPVLLTDDKNVKNWIKPLDNQPLHFEMVGVGKPKDVPLRPFYQVYKEYYSVYWDYFTTADWQKRQAEYEAEKKRLQEVTARTVDFFRIGEMQPERDHNLQASEKSYVSDAIGVNGREVRAGGFFSFEMNVDTTGQNTLMLTYIGDDKDRKFDIVVNGTKIKTEELTGGKSGKFYDREYVLPGELIGTHKKATIRIESNYGKTAGRIFGVRIIK